MADLHRRRQLETAHATNVITYGHLGTPSYSETLKSWTFLRQNAGEVDDEDQDAPLTASASTAFPFALPEDSVRTVTTAGPAQQQHVEDVPSTRGKARHRLLRALPELAPGLAGVDTELNKDFHQRSSQVPLQPNLSDSLAFGGAVLLNDHGKGKTIVPIIAYVAGDSGESVKFARIERESMCLGDMHSVVKTYLLPRIQLCNPGCWSSTGEQVQQICFAAPQSDRSMHSTWMAVCQPSTTTILHPLQHRPAVVLRQTRRRIPPASGLDPNPVLSIPKSRTGDAFHAHVAFHPQDHGTVAIIDVQGNWSIWKIEGKSAIVSHVLYQAHLRMSRKLYSWRDVPRPVEAPPYHDGWHRIMWLRTSTGVADGILACNRMHTLAYDTTGDELNDLDMRLNIRKVGHQILDVQKSTLLEGHFLVLTSIHVLCFSPSDANGDNAGERRTPVLLFAWQHFRGRADLSLRLRLLETGRVTTAILTSALNSVVTAIRFGFNPASSSIVALTDPERITLPLHTASVQSIRHLAFYAVQARRRFQTATDDADDAVFIKLFWQTSGLNIVEALFLSNDHEKIQPDRPLRFAAVVLPSKQSLRLSTFKSSKYAEPDPDDFVVADDGIDEQETADESADEPLEIQTLPLRQSPVNSGSTLDWSDIYQMAVVDTVTDFGEGVASIEERLQEEQDDVHSLQLLSRLIGLDTRLGDIEEDARKFQDLVNRILTSPRLQISTTGLVELVRSEDISSTISQRYNRLVEAWLTSLPPTVSDRARVSKERLIRSVVADLTLASTAVRPKPTPADSTPTNPTPSQSSQDVFSSSIPKSSFTAQRSSSSHQPAQVSAIDQDAACLRLRAYAPLTKPINAVSTSPAMVDMLAHLPTDPHADPAQYDWRAVELTQALHHQETTQPADPRVRRKVEKLASAKRRQQESQQRLNQAAEQARLSSMGLSSQNGTERGMYSSQIQEPSKVHATRKGDRDMDLTPSSLVIRSRSPPKTKKDKGKKRTQGF